MRWSSYALWLVPPLLALAASIAGAMRRRGQPFERWPLWIRAGIGLSAVWLLSPVIRFLVERYLTPLRGLLFEEPSPWLFILVTLVMGGAAAWVTGRSCAQTWRGPGLTVVYLMILGLAVRFVHFALFQGTLLSPHYYAVDAAVLLAVGLAAWQATRARQMSRQYWWLYERTGPFGYRRRPVPLSSRPGGS